MKIVLADDHPMIRTGMNMLLTRINPSSEIFEAGNYGETLQACKKHQDIDLVLIDWVMPDMDGDTGTRLIRHALPHTPIIIISASQDTTDVWAALDEGANGFVSKACTEDVLQHAIQLVIAGGTYLPADIVGINRESVNASMNTSASKQAPDNFSVTSSKPQQADVQSLTQRQREVLALLVEGHSNKKIARLLSISNATVNTHVSAIFKLLNVNSRTEAAYAANQLKLVINPAN